MNKKLGALIILILAGSTLAIIAPRLWEARASSTIVIEADGSITPPTASIDNFNNVLYTFLSNINDSIEIQRDNIVLDGAGYTLNGTGSSTGVLLWGRNNVTVSNINITGFNHGVYLHNSMNCNVTGNVIQNVNRAIFLYLDSNFNNIAGNDITSRENGIQIWQSSNCTISANNITCERAENKFGIYLLDSSNNNTINSNTISECQAGIYLDSSSHNKLHWNNATVTGRGQDGGGIWLEQSDLNILHGNYIAESSWHGIELDQSSNNTISDNEVEDNSNRGIMVHTYSNFNNITGNYIARNYKGIEVSSSSHHAYIHENNLTATQYEAIVVEYSWNNTISGNNLVDNNSGIALLGADFNVVAENIITDGGHAINLNQASNNTLFGNNLTNNYFGLVIQSSTENTLTENAMVNNTCNFSLYANTLQHFINDVDSSNTVDHHPIYYWIDAIDSVVPQDAGCVILVNCTDITVQDMNLSANNRQGAVLAHSANITVADSYIANNDQYGIWLWNSSNCQITGNYLKNFIGIQLAYSSSNTIYGNTLTAGGNWGCINLVQSFGNTFYGNNFTDNYIDYLINDESANDWDNGYPDGGNYWDNYEERYSYAEDAKSGPYQNETGSDGFWDIPYVLNEGNVDHYPIVPEFPSLVIMPLFMIGAIFAAIAFKKSRPFKKTD